MTASPSACFSSPFWAVLPSRSTQSGSTILGPHEWTGCTGLRRIRQGQNKDRERGGGTHHLLVGEHGAVVDEGHAVAGVAALAHARLSDAAAVYLHAGRVGTHLALEEGLLHLWNQLGCPNHHATDGDELIDVCKVERMWLVSARRGPLLGSGSAVQPWRTSPQAAWGAGVTGDSVARALTPRWAPSALAWDAPPVQVTLNPSSLLTCTKLGQTGCLGTTRLMTWLQQPMCL